MPVKAPSRATRLARALDFARDLGAVRDWYTYAPGDRYGRRWIVSVAGYGSHTFSTREAEAFCLGVDACNVAALSTRG